MLPSLLGSPCLVYHIMLAVLFSVIIQILQAVAEILLIPITRGRKRHNKKPKEAQSFKFFFYEKLLRPETNTKISSTTKWFKSIHQNGGNRRKTNKPLLHSAVSDSREKKKEAFFLFPRSQLNVSKFKFLSFPFSWPQQPNKSEKDPTTMYVNNQKQKETSWRRRREVPLKRNQEAMAELWKIK